MKLNVSTKINFDGDNFRFKETLFRRDASLTFAFGITIYKGIQLGVEFYPEFSRTNRLPPEPTKLVAEMAYDALSHIGF